VEARETQTDAPVGWKTREVDARVVGQPLHPVTPEHATNRKEGALERQETLDGRERYQLLRALRKKDLEPASTLPTRSWPQAPTTSPAFPSR